MLLNNIGRYLFPTDMHSRGSMQWEIPRNGAMPSGHLSCQHHTGPTPTHGHELPRHAGAHMPGSSQPPREAVAAPPLFRGRTGHEGAGPHAAGKQATGQQAHNWGWPARPEPPQCHTCNQQPGLHTNLDMCPHLPASSQRPGASLAPRSCPAGKPQQETGLTSEAACE